MNHCSIDDCNRVALHDDVDLCRDHFIATLPLAEERLSLFDEMVEAAIAEATADPG